MLHDPAEVLHDPAEVLPNRAEEVLPNQAAEAVPFCAGLCACRIWVAAAFCNRPCNGAAVCKRLDILPR